MKNIPEVLFKYRNWEEDNAEYSFGRQTIENCQVYFSAAEQFNDPFDGTLPFRYKEKDLTSENIFLKLFEILKVQFPNEPDSQLHTLAYERQSTVDIAGDALWKQFHPHFKEMFNDTFGILSLTSERDNILMWSHYANSHKGYCIGFDTAMLFHASQGQIGKVIYDDKFPEMDLFPTDLEGIVRLTSTKATNWEYEQEYRIVVHSPKSSLLLPKSCVKQIVLGCRMSEKHKNQIYKIANLKYPQAELFELAIDDEKFKLNFLPIFK